MIPTLRSPIQSQTQMVGMQFWVPLLSDGVMARMSSNQSGDCNARSARRELATDAQGLGSQRDFRLGLIEDCMVALPGQLFYSTQIPVCLWFLAKNKNADAKRGKRPSLDNELALAA